ncbi:F-box domain protein [Ancylostoma duodenale]|uniref:F-box domain protein n=1 Tax=Ancylostoma duodenale TaxID=51022 RepID=A0A0C2H4V6_9BILA|nr:F-box domain protein [Ancylostoma duodenale]
MRSLRLIAAERVRDAANVLLLSRKRIPLYKLNRIRIFSYLDMKTLCRCAQTCRLWNVLALDGSNWQRVDLFTFQKDDSALRSFTAKCANIEHLSLYKCKRVTDA